MSKRLLYTIIGVAALLLVAIGGGLIWRNQINKAAEKEAEAQRLQALSPAAILATNHKKILFISETRQPPLQRKLYLLDAVTQNTIELTDNFIKPYSNFLSETNTWFDIIHTTLRKHELTPAGIITTTITEIKNSPAANSNLAVSPNGEWISWISGTNEAQQIIVYNVTNAIEVSLYEADSPDTFSNLAWSPDNTELAFTAASTNQLITITTAGVQLYNPSSIPFSQFNFVHWIEPNHLAAVLSSTPENTTSFSPKVAVFARDGTVLENHTLFSKIGIPAVVWSTDGSALMFYDPWTNNFLTYDRFDTLQSVVPSHSTAVVIPFGWIAGEDVIAAIPPKNTIPVTTKNSTTPTTNTPFALSAEQWDYYNTATRAVLGQFSVDFSTYHFNVTERGIAVDIHLAPATAKPEKIFIQTLVQLVAVLPDLPSISLQMIMDDQTTLAITDFTPAQAKDLVARFTTQPLDQLFIVTTDSPYGMVAVKSTTPQQNYLGDLLYADTGEYNPVPALAFMKTTSTTQSFWTDRFALFYPNTWQTKNLKELVGNPYQANDTLFYTTDTTFVSPSVWQGFSVTIREYAIPEFGLKEWLQVNRSDSTIEDITFTLHQPLEGKHIVTNQPSTDEYILYANHVVYVLAMARQPNLTEEDRATLQNVIQSFSDHSIFTAN